MSQRDDFENATHHVTDAPWCAWCDEDIFVVSLLANKHVRTVKDPMAGELPGETYESLKEKDRLPPVAERQEVDIDVE